MTKTSVPKTLKVAWAEYGDQSQGEHLRATGPKYEVLSIGAVRAPADADWKSKVPFGASAEEFNRLVGWTTSHYHWAAVGSKGTVNGDEPTIEACKKAAELAVGVRS